MDASVEEDRPLDGVMNDKNLYEPAAGQKLPGGTRTGDWLHALFENLDFANQGKKARDGRKLADLVPDLAQRHGVRDEDAWQLVPPLLRGWLKTPLDAPFPSGPGLPKGFTLGKLDLAARLDEMRFDLRLGAGDRWRPSMRGAQGDYTGRLNPASIREALNAARDDKDFGGRFWLNDLLQRPGKDGDEARILPAIAGVLMGFVDLTFRVGDRNDTYFVLDYKSNMLKGPEALREKHQELVRQEGKDAPWLRRLHYTPEGMAWGMSHHAYHLQALIYTVALHRLLRQRLGPDYPMKKHLGGHLYLFLRGMEGAKTPRVGKVPLGVWADRWPDRTVAGLDCALDGGDVKAVKDAMARVAGGGK